jgi:hypothetical protein
VFALLSPGLLAIVIAAISGRSLGRLWRQRVAWWPLGLGGLVLEAVLYTPQFGREPWLRWASILWIAALLGTFAMLARNAWLRRSALRWAWALAALGVSLNLVVVIANGGHMPQSQTARIAAGASVERVAGLASEPGWRNVAPMTSDTRLAWLGDVFPEPAWLPLHNVMSLGDLLLASGVAAVIYLSTARRPRRGARVIRIVAAPRGTDLRLLAWTPTRPSSIAG